MIKIAWIKALSVLSLSLCALGCQPKAENVDKLSALDNDKSSEKAPLKQANQQATAKRKADDKFCRNQLIIDSFKAERSNVQVHGCGTVAKILPDDKKGSRHQKFIVRLKDSKHTVLIAHNIDLSARVADLKQGDVVMFYGEYEYSEEGGTVHWTHKDPSGRHQNGFIRHAEQKYD